MSAATDDSRVARAWPPPPKPPRRRGFAKPIVLVAGALVVVVAAAALLDGRGPASGQVSPTPPAGPTHEPTGGQPPSGDTAVAEGLAPGEAPPIEPGPDLGAIGVRDAPLEELVEGAQGYYPGTTWWVMLREGATRADADALLARFDGGTNETVIAGEIAYIGAYQLLIPEPVPADAWERAEAWLLEQPEVAAVAADTLWMTQDCADELATGDYARGDNAGAYRMIGAEKAWAAYFASGVPKYGARVGVVDSPLGRATDAARSELETATFDEAGPAMLDASGIYDGLFHADGVVGLVAGDRGNGGVVGLASPLGAGLVLTHVDMGHNEWTEGQSTPRSAWFTGVDGTTTSFSLALANTMRAVERGATVINLSLGSTTIDPGHAGQAAMWRAFLERMNRDHPEVLFVVAAGNNRVLSETTGEVAVTGHLDGHNYAPAGIAAPNLITVAAVQNDNSLAHYSNTLAPGAGADAEVTLAAPGDQAFRGVGASGADVNTFGGTSSAAPLVTAAAAMMRAVNPQLDANEIKEILARTAQTGPEGAGGRTLDMGAAMLDVVNTARRMRGLPRLDDASLATLAAEACALEVTAAPAGPSSRPDAVDWNVAAQLPLLATPTHVTITVGGLRPTDWRVAIGSPGDIAAWGVSAPAPGVAAIVARADSGYWVRRWLAAEGAAPVEPPTPGPVQTAPPTPEPPVATAAPEQPAPVPPDCGPAPPAGTLKYLEWAKRCQQIGG